MIDKERAMDWIQGGYGVEDVAVIMRVSVAEVRAMVAEYRADGSLMMRLVIEPDHGTFLHCRRGHRQDAATLGKKPDGIRYCKTCHRSAQRKGSGKRQQAAKAYSSLFGDRA